MAVKVYYKPVPPNCGIEKIQEISRVLLNTLTAEENLSLEKTVPLKVHFGEHRNVSFLKPQNYLGIIDWLQKRGSDSCYIETSVLYGGQRYKRELHEKTAAAHGFTQLPIVFADGDHGESYAEIEINKKHFKTFKLGRAFLNYPQMIVCSHFKGHILAGFGGAIKMLSMGCAAKGGKMAMHLGEKPRIISRKCTRCKKCLSRCNEQALILGKKSYIDQQRCVGCGACIAICPHGAVTILSVKNALKFIGLGNPFLEKMVEGAYAAALGKKNIYLNFALNITPGCDCEPRKMKPLMDDIGVFISSDPVAVDKACWDTSRRRGKKFRGHKAFSYAESLGLGSTNYELIEIS
jgi:uncharacterized Fe-S center protein